MRNYFAYGSNLNLEDLRNNFSYKKNGGDSLMVKVSNAFLKDHRLVFNSYSRMRGGGVASVVYSKGDIVPGGVFSVDADTEYLLDCKEGAGYLTTIEKKKKEAYAPIEEVEEIEDEYLWEEIDSEWEECWQEIELDFEYKNRKTFYSYGYVKIDVEVESKSGEKIRCFTYQYQNSDSFKKWGERYVEPSDEYYAIIYRGYLKNDLEKYIECLKAAALNDWYPDF